MRSASKSVDEKKSFEDFEAPTRTTPTTNEIRFLSKMRSTLGVEARGAYHISKSEPNQPDQSTLYWIP